MISNNQMRAKTFDNNGIEISYYKIDDNKHGPSKNPVTVVCCGGLGGTHLIWSSLVRALRVKYPILIWNYPGLVPGDSLDKAVDIGVPALATYLDGLVRSENLQRIFLVGWSLGVQVAVEYTALGTDLVAGLAAVCGVAGDPFATQTYSDPLRSILKAKRASWPAALGWLSERLERIDRLRALLSGIESPSRWAKRFGLVDPLIDDLVFDALVRDFVSVDGAIYNRYARAAAEHDASALLGQLPFPLLVVSGERDKFALPDRLKEMAETVPSGEYFEVRGATHYLPLEYGPLLALKIDDFIERQGIV